MATLAARDDLMAGFTAERDMGTEGAGSADTAVRNAIDQGLIPGPRLRISGNAVDILGGHEDANRLQPRAARALERHLRQQCRELVTVIREQFKEGADFIKIYETGPDSVRDGHLSTPFQYTEAELDYRRRAKPRAPAIASPSMPPANPEHSTPLAPAWHPSTMPIN